jgi:hypothetical protein
MAQALQKRSPASGDSAQIADLLRGYKGWRLAFKVVFDLRECELNPGEVMAVKSSLEDYMQTLDEPALLLIRSDSVFLMDWVRKRKYNFMPVAPSLIEGVKKSSECALTLGRFDKMLTPIAKAKMFNYLVIL